MIPRNSFMRRQNFGRALLATPREPQQIKKNVVSVILPYRLEGVWVFDDAAVGLVREPFISGADNILDVLRKTSRTPQAASKSSSRRDPFQATPPDSFGLEAAIPVPNNTLQCALGGANFRML
jgi:hypothetical protein